MTPEEKAEDLIDSFIRDGYDIVMSEKLAKRCALIAVDEIIQLLERTSPNSYSHNFYKQTRNEIENI